MRRIRPVLDRFWEKVAIADRDECWLWHGPRDQLGYGKFGIGGRRANGGVEVKAHRFAYEIMVGPIPEGLEPDHLCRTASCVNPSHLEPVTHAENMRRGNSAAGINHRKTECVHGHAFDSKNTRIKIDNRGRTHRSCKTCEYEGQRRRRTKVYPPQLIR